MNYDESIAKRYFEENGFENILYEPNGNVPPDFVIDGSIAVEVRRLNQYHKSSTNVKALEELNYKLIPRIENLFNTYGDKRHEASAFVSISYGRPLRVDNFLLKEIEKILDLHSLSMTSTEEYNVTENLTLTIFPSSERLINKFHSGCTADNNSGGYVLSNLIDSLEIIISEKELKIAKFKNQYQTWWLALIDYMGYGLDNTELNYLKESINSKGFDRIYFISPIDSKKGSYV